MQAQRLRPSTPDNEAIYQRFTQRKRESAERVAGLKASLAQHQRLNREALKRRRDVLQAEAVQELLDKYLPQN